jgi:quercetin dioxygenase-like cupin family protein
MPKYRVVALALSSVLAIFLAGRVEAQAGAGSPAWETLIQKPLPEDTEPKVSIFSIVGPPAPPVPPPIGTGHIHAGPVFVYILQGEIETQIEPDPPGIYKPDEFFYEAPRHVHLFQRNLSKTEPSRVIIFQAGNTGQPAPVVKLLLQEPLRTTVNQELSLLRLTLPPGALSAGRAHSGPGFVYVLEGKIETSGTTDQPKIHNAGDLFVEQASRAGLTFKNASGTGTARLLLYQVNEKDPPGATP